MAPTASMFDVKPLLPSGRGYIEVPFDTSLTEPFAKEIACWLLRYPTREERCRFQESVCGEPDLGYMRRFGEEEYGHKKDHKHIWHYNPAFGHRIRERACHEDERLFLSADRLYMAALTVACKVLMDLARAGYPELLERFSQATNQPLPRSDHVLRGLLYDDKLPREANQNIAAQGHCDRGVLTVHCGDDGGELFCIKDGKVSTCSPRPGHAAVFLGVKAQILTHGELKPLLHGSVREANVCRRAWPFFAHAVTKVPVHSWSDVVANPEQYYE